MFKFNNKKNKMLKEHSGLYTDLYELSMSQAYFYSGKEHERACFDYFFRKAPFKGSYVIFAGLRTLYEILENLNFSEIDCTYLNSIGFKEEFLNYLLSFKFQATIHSPEEGDLIFPFEPVVRVEGSLIETQLIETVLLNILNFESLIATKASRIKFAAGDRIISEFGLRRAQGFGGLQASRAAIIGGADSTSNVYSAYKLGTHAAGTQAHSWIQSFPTELTAFRKFAEMYPDNCILLVDTYNTLESGVPNAITVAKELQKKGYALKGIRLDSGNIEQLSKIARRMLDMEGLVNVKILVSNQMDEMLINSLVQQEAPIDIFGVGTSLATGSPDGFLDGVYKLSFINNRATLKISENIEKISLPGIKKIYRYFDDNGFYIADGITLEDETGKEKIYEKYKLNDSIELNYENRNPLHQLTMQDGISKLEKKTTNEIRDYSKNQFFKLPEKHKKLIGPVQYKVGYSRKLWDLQRSLILSIKHHKSII